MTDPLTPADFNTRTWERLEAVLQARLSKLREENDDRLDETSTAFVRGRIAELKELLLLPENVAAPAKGGFGSASSFDAFPAP